MDDESIKAAKIWFQAQQRKAETFKRDIQTQFQSQWALVQHRTGVTPATFGVVIGSFFVGVCSGVFLRGSNASLLVRLRSRYSPSRLKNDGQIPQAYVDNKVYVRGKVVSVSDGDTIRVYHTPFCRSSKPPRPASKTSSKSGFRMSENTLSVRLAGIDTPETAKFGKAGQPFGEEAKQALTDLVLNHMVRVQLLAKDQYGRCVGAVEVLPKPYSWPVRFIKRSLHIVSFGYIPYARDASLKLIENGLATVYTQAGAVYSPRLPQAALSRYEEVARSRKLGMFSQKKVETPAEYKARTQGS